MTTQNVIDWELIGKLDSMTSDFVIDNRVLEFIINAIRCGTIPQNLNKFQKNHIYILAVRGNAEVLSLIPDDDKTLIVCFFAVRKCGMALRHVPNDNKTLLMCETAVLRCCDALQYVPENIKALMNGK